MQCHAVPPGGPGGPGGAGCAAGGRPARGLGRHRQQHHLHDGVLETGFVDGVLRRVLQCVPGAALPQRHDADVQEGCGPRSPAGRRGAGVGLPALLRRCLHDGRHQCHRCHRYTRGQGSVPVRAVRVGGVQEETQQDVPHPRRVEEDGVAAAVPRPQHVARHAPLGRGPDERVHRPQDGHRRVQQTIQVLQESPEPVCRFVAAGGGDEAHGAAADRPQAQGHALRPQDQRAPPARRAPPLRLEGEGRPDRAQEPGHLWLLLGLRRDGRPGGQELHPHAAAGAAERAEPPGLRHAKREVRRRHALGRLRLGAVQRGSGGVHQLPLRSAARPLPPGQDATVPDQHARLHERVPRHRGERHDRPGDRGPARRRRQPQSGLVPGLPRRRVLRPGVQLRGGRAAPRHAAGGLRRRPGGRALLDAAQLVGPRLGRGRPHPRGAEGQPVRRHVLRRVPGAGRRAGRTARRACHGRASARLKRIAMQMPPDSSSLRRLAGLRVATRRVLVTAYTAKREARRIKVARNKHSVWPFSSTVTPTPAAAALTAARR